jgi:Trp operon repressor
MASKRLRLKIALLRSGLTARQIAPTLGVSEWTLSRIINGRQRADRSFLSRLDEVIAAGRNDQRKKKTAGANEAPPAV